MTEGYTLKGKGNAVVNHYNLIFQDGASVMGERNQHGIGRTLRYVDLAPDVLKAIGRDEGHYKVQPAPVKALPYQKGPEMTPTMAHK